MMGFLGSFSYVARFLAAVMFVVLVGTTGVCLYIRRFDLAFASAVVAGWCLTMFFEVVKQELIEGVRGGSAAGSGTEGFK